MDGTLVICGLLVLVGLFGIVVPVLPGTVLVLLGFLIWASETGTAESWTVFAVGCDGGRDGQLLGLVHDAGRDLAELVTVLAGVVGAEEQLTTALELHAKVGLGAASVAAVDRGERRGGGGCRSGHGRPHSRLGYWFNDSTGGWFPGVSPSSVTTVNHGGCFPSARCPSVRPGVAPHNVLSRV